MSKYINGREALGYVDRVIGDVRKTLANAIDAVESADARSGEVRRLQVEAYSKLATIRLDLLNEGTSVDQLDAAERKARKLLAKHETYLEEEQQDLVARASDVEKLEDAREALAVKLDASVETYEARVAEIKQDLGTDKAYQALEREAEEAAAVSARAEQKLELAKADRIEKGEPYDGDILFSYLWKRKFRTPDYEGGGITKMLDNWVAKLIGYDRAYLNYARLTELPERLAEHVERVEEDEEAAQERLVLAEQTALTEGGAETLRAAADDLREQLTLADQKIEAAEEAHMAAAARHEAMLSGETGPAKQARQVLEDALRSLGFPDLKLLAAETLNLDDDRLVDRLVKLRSEEMSYDLEKDRLHRAPSGIKRDLKSLETLRSGFKRARMDSPYASFKAAAMDSVLSGLLRGGMDVNRALRSLSKSMRRREPRTDPGFGGRRRQDTLGLPEILGDVAWEVLKQGGRSGGWGARQSRGRGPRIKIPKSRSPRRSGKRRGGFKTGGGF